MKGAFLVTEALGKAGAVRPYTFRPYHYGPFSREVYHDLDALVAEGLAERLYLPPAAYPSYCISPAGSRRAESLRTRAGSSWSDYVAALREWLDGRSFADLLRVIYRHYPQYATATVLPHLVAQP